MPLTIMYVDSESDITYSSVHVPLLCSFNYYKHIDDMILN